MHWMWPYVLRCCKPLLCCRVLRTLKLRTSSLDRGEESPEWQYNRKEILKISTRADFVFGNLKKMTLDGFNGSKMEVLLLHALGCCFPAIGNVTIIPFSSTRYCACRILMEYPGWVCICGCKYSKHVIAAMEQVRKSMPQVRVINYTI
ncbi:hypothetical protein Droror1_Dr00022721 [Drosera rotundifolia]